MGGLGAVGLGAGGAAGAEKVYPYLLSGIAASYPNHVWEIDLTYVRLRGGWMYLVAILDWFSRYAVDWELDETLGIDFVLEKVVARLSGLQTSSVVGGTRRQWLRVGWEWS